MHFRNNGRTFDWRLGRLVYRTCCCIIVALLTNLGKLNIGGLSLVYLGFNFLKFLLYSQIDRLNRIKLVKLTLKVSRLATDINA